jgi:hypothetical protein
MLEFLENVVKCNLEYGVAERNKLIIKLARFPISFDLE